MTDDKKFDPKKLEKLNNPERVKTINPDIVWEKLNLSDPHVLVDLGAGTGFFAALFCKKMEKGEIYACDTSDIMVNWMKDNLSVEGGCTIAPTKSEENHVPLPESVADLVYLINVYHELEEPEKLLSESYRLLKDGGKIAVIDWKKEETTEGPPLSHRISENNVINCIKSAGFLKIENYGVLPYHYFITGTLQK